MKKYPGLILLMLLAGRYIVRAEEGMWIPMLIEKYQIGALQEAGFRLEASDIYSINQECLKDAIVIFMRGCTGEMISDDGLVLTNHHCGEAAIQAHSSMQQDYLTNGYWAMSREEELPNEEVTVTFLRYMEEVTEAVNEGLYPGMDPQERKRLMELNQGKIIREATAGTYYDAEVKSFYYGNRYYLFVYEKFRDVRLVGAPPVSIGNFGGDRDNWMWPRHTGDFSLFRVYADENNQPADYTPSNKPYRPRKHLEINTGGIQEGDFTMVLGYPGRTTQYLHSAAVKMMMETSLPLKIGLRTARLEIMDRYMKESEVVRIRYAYKYYRVSNAWKNWQGVIMGLKRNHAVEKKMEDENLFMKWVDEDGERQLKYDQLMDGFAQLYDKMEPYTVAIDLMEEAIKPVELFRQADQILGMMQLGLPADDIELRMNLFFKDFHGPLDRDIFAAMMKVYLEYMPLGLYPDFFNEVREKHRGDFSRYAESVYRMSILGDPERSFQLLDTYGKDPGKALKRVREDPISICLTQLRELYYISVNPGYEDLREEEERLYRSYMEGLLEKHTEKILYPDANRTLRLSYGKVMGYQPRDGVRYGYATTLSGLFEKGREEDPDYAIPARLAELYENRDYGRYGVNGTMPVCFIATNHTSGGNSGSPVLDGSGRLVGLNFDRDWEGTMSDVIYDPSLCRNIAVDIRYVLFIIDKFAGAGYLLDEMDIIW